eukprot:20616-Heterococcus_DN1.PRE.1
MKDTKQSDVAEFALYWAARSRLCEDENQIDEARALLDQGDAYISVQTQRLVLKKSAAAFETRVELLQAVEVHELLDSALSPVKPLVQDDAVDDDDVDDDAATGMNDDSMTSDENSASLLNDSCDMTVSPNSKVQNKSSKGYRYDPNDASFVSAEDSIEPGSNGNDGVALTKKVLTYNITSAMQQSDGSDNGTSSSSATQNDISAMSPKTRTAMLDDLLFRDDDDDDVQVGELEQDAKATTTDTAIGDTDTKASTASAAIASSGDSGATTTSNSVSFNEDNNMDIVYDSNKNSSNNNNNNSGTVGIMDNEANDILADDANDDVQVNEVPKSCINRKATPHVSRRKSKRATGRSSITNDDDDDDDEDTDITTATETATVGTTSTADAATANTHNDDYSDSNNSAISNVVVYDMAPPAPRAPSTRTATTASSKKISTSDNGTKRAGTPHPSAKRRASKPPATANSGIDSANDDSAVGNGASAGGSSTSGVTTKRVDTPSKAKDRVSTPVRRSMRLSLLDSNDKAAKANSSDAKKQTPA